MSRSPFPLPDSQMQALPVELRGVLKSVIYFYDAQMTELWQEILGEDFSGLIITDRYVGYDWDPIQQRQLCWAHLIRAL